MGYMAAPFLRRAPLGIFRLTPNAARATSRRALLLDYYRPVQGNIPAEAGHGPRDEQSGVRRRK